MLPTLNLYSIICQIISVKLEKKQGTDYIIVREGEI